MKKILFTLCGLLVGFSIVTAQITLTFNPAKGAKYAYTMKMDQKINQSVMGQEFSMDQTISTMYEMDVTDKNSDEIKIKFTYKEVFYELSSAMLSIQYDSNHPDEHATGPDEIIAKIYNCFIGRGFDVVMTPDGSVKSVTGMDEMVEEMMKVLGDDMMSQQLGGSMQGQFSNESMRATFEQSFKMYPKKPIKVNDSWNTEININTANMPMKIQSVYTLKSANSKEAMVNVVSEIDAMDGQLTGTQGGVMNIDPKTGLPLKSEIEQNMKGTISANGMDVSMDMESIITMTTKEVN